ncbi:MAG: hypothetical protein JSV17_08945 [Candidatus Aminicenantes bacterium]|nr:MAG: hypothetical protein JSV17_08945 [Candidatus Aminicenantes bacterium]
MKNFSFILAIIILGIIVAAVAHFTGLWETMSHEDLEGSFELLDIETKWVEKIYQPWPPRLVLVPAISFKIKNISEKPLKYFYVNANFKFRDDVANLGDGFIEAIRGKPLMPGETTEPILLKSTFGVDGQNLEQIRNNPFFLSKIVDVKMFAKSQGSQYIPVGEWEVSKNIDFKEPEPFGEKPEKKKTEDKN